MGGVQVNSYLFSVWGDVVLGVVVVLTIPYLLLDLPPPELEDTGT